MKPGFNPFRLLNKDKIKEDFETFISTLDYTRTFNEYKELGSITDDKVQASFYPLLGKVIINNTKPLKLVRFLLGDMPAEDIAEIRSHYQDLLREELQNVLELDREGFVLLEYINLSSDMGRNKDNIISNASSDVNKLLARISVLAWLVKYLERGANDGNI